MGGIKRILSAEKRLKPGKTPNPRLEKMN